MLLTEYLERYASLLRTRLAAARRNALLAGALFAGAILAALWLNLSTEPDSRSTFLNVTVLVLLGLGCVSTWSRWETIKEIMQLTEELHAAGTGSSPNDEAVKR